MYTEKTTYRYLIFLIMLCITIKLTTLLLIYKIIKLGPFSASASTLIMPLWFVIGDIIAEVYGYKIARHVIWMALLCQFIFAFTCASFSYLHSPINWTDQEVYHQTLSKLPRVALASFLAIITGTFINIYTLSKWKILLKGKYFWIRSLGASSIGELVFTIIAYLTEFLGMIPFEKLLELMIISYVIKLIMNPILSIPAALLSTKLKQLEGIDIYDYFTNFNPFKLNISDQKTTPLNTLEPQYK